MHRYWISLVSSVFVASLSQVLLKKSANTEHKNRIEEYMNINVIVGYAMMVISTLLVIYSYTGIEYKNGSVIESLGYILVMLFGRMFFDEKITRNKLLGNLLIIVGVILFYL